MHIHPLQGCCAFKTNSFYICLLNIHISARKWIFPVHFFNYRKLWTLHISQINFSVFLDQIEREKKGKRNVLSLYSHVSKPCYATVMLKSAQWILENTISYIFRIYFYKKKRERICGSEKWEFEGQAIAVFTFLPLSRQCIIWINKNKKVRIPKLNFILACGMWWVHCRDFVFVFFVDWFV